VDTKTHTSRATGQSGPNKGLCLLYGSGLNTTNGRRCTWLTEHSIDGHRGMMGKQGAIYHLELAVDGLPPTLWGGGWAGRQFVLSQVPGRHLPSLHRREGHVSPFGPGQAQGREMERCLLGQVWKKGRRGRGRGRDRGRRKKSEHWKQSHAFH